MTTVHQLSKVLAAATVLFFSSCMNREKEFNTADESITVTDTSISGKKITELSAAISSDPSNADLLHQRAKLYIQKNDFASASGDMQRVMKLDTTKADYFVTLSDILLAANKPSRSKAALEKCIELEPAHKEGNMKLAELYFIARQYDNVFKYLNNVLKADVHNPKAYFMKGMAYKELGDTVKSISSFQTAIEQEPGYYDTFMQL
jgi:predicted Zn-dependent protease